MYSRWETFKERRPAFFNIDPKRVQGLATQTRNCIACTVADDFENGSENVVFRVRFVDGIDWICRVLGEKLVSPEHSEAEIKTWVATMRYVKFKSSIVKINLLDSAPEGS